MSFRLDDGGTEIDRGRPLSFTFDGRTLAGFDGDTIASALLGAGISIVGRSFKYHRPRGIWGAGVEEPNGIVDIVTDGRRTTNVRTTTTPLREGMAVESLNAWPDATRDRKAALGLLAPFIPAGFYYKTFMWPAWRVFQPSIRAMAGLGRLDRSQDPRGHFDQRRHDCDLLVVGAGPAGLSAALEAAGSGRSVMLIDDGLEAGGTLRYRSGVIDGLSGPDWVARTLDQLQTAGITYLPRTTAFGCYDHGHLGLYQDLGSGRGTRWIVRARRVVQATGAIERPLPFGSNDLPGIMSADAALQYLRRHGVVPGQKVICVTNNDSTDEVIIALRDSGIGITLVDARERRPVLPGVQTIAGRRVVSARGRRRVARLVLDDGRVLKADGVIVSGGWTPSVHLYSQSGSPLAWKEEEGGFVPGDRSGGIVPAGAAAGLRGLSETLASGAAAVTPASKVEDPTLSDSATLPIWPGPKNSGRTWVDYQNDVTTKDIALAVRENFVSVEHLKRYTTLGMATDQGKTSNLNGLAMLAGLTERTIPEVGTTRYRPPFVPIPMMAFRGLRGGALLHPLRRLPLDVQHREAGAQMREYGGWQRPAHYSGPSGGYFAIAEEARRARAGVGLFDASPLGKIEVIGPQAGALMEFVQLGTMASLKPGRCRYSLMLAENGVVFDDGIVLCLAPDRYVVSCSSAHVGAVMAQLEEWRQTRFDTRRVFIHDATTSLATLTLTGPAARAVAARLDPALGEVVGDQPHMTLRETTFAGDPIRVTRASFTGDPSFELSVPVHRAPVLLDRVLDAGRDHGIARIGVEAMMILRTEKGFIVPGVDTDGTTLPWDLGVPVPQAKAGLDFVGRLSLVTEDALRHDRRQLVGLAVGPGEPPIPVGAHAVERDGRGVRSLGFVTSSCHSPTLGRPVALGLIECGAARHGETVSLRHLGVESRATLCPPCAYDPEGARLNA